MTAQWRIAILIKPATVVLALVSSLISIGCFPQRPQDLRQLKSYTLALEMHGGLPGDITLKQGSLDFVSPCDDGGPDCCPSNFVVLSINSRRSVLSLDPHVISKEPGLAKRSFSSSREPKQLPYREKMMIAGLTAEATVSAATPADPEDELSVHLSIKVNGVGILEDQFNTGGPFELLAVSCESLLDSSQPEILLLFTSYRTFGLRIYSARPEAFSPLNDALRSMWKSISELRAGTESGTVKKTECQAFKELTSTWKK